MTREDLRVLTFWLPAKLVNTLNARTHWAVDAKRARQQRDAVCAAVLEALGHAYQLRVGPAVPKHVRFAAAVAKAFDDDGLQAALKHVRDGLIDARILDDDAPDSGHVFEYTQTLAGRTPRGVQITVTVR
jgi:hypothetical protein